MTWIYCIGAIACLWGAAAFAFSKWVDSDTERETSHLRLKRKYNEDRYL